MPARLPSIRRRLTQALLAWALLFSVAISLAVWLAAREETNELLDDSLEAAAEVLVRLLGPLADQAAPTLADAPELLGVDGQPIPRRFAWQLVGADARVLLRSPGAPDTPWQIESEHGFANLPGWRVHSAPVGSKGRVLYVAQSRDERYEAVGELTLHTVLAALAVALLGHLWLRAHLSHELAPLQRLSQRLGEHDPIQPAASLGPAERAELQPVHEAIDALAQRLALRLSSERAFSAHAAHALRTPLAGIDVQLAVALREAPPPLQPRLQRVRDAAARLQRVVVALLTLFRSGEQARPQRVELASLFARLPVEGLQVEVAPGAALQADADLLSAALLNLLDNAQRHGARHVRVSLPAPQTLRLHDDGSGVDAARREALLRALQAQREGRASEDGSDGGPSGLGLLLAELVARAHGGRLALPAVEQGFAVELQLAAG